MTAVRFPMTAPDLHGNETAYVLEALKRGEIGPGGGFRDMFEQRFAAEVGAYGTLGTSSGTTALHLAIDLAGIMPGDEVIVPSLTYVATANAVWQAGGAPVLADVDPRTWCLDPASVAERITARTRGIITVHLLGHVAPPEPLRALAHRHGLWVIADCAHAALTRVDGHGIGAIHDGAAFSFHLNKSITCGEGGAIAVADAGQLDRARIRRSHGMDYHQRAVFHDFGYNYRLSNLHCALLCAQLERAEEIRRHRCALGEAYRAAFADCEEIQVQAGRPGLDPEVWSFGVLVDKHCSWSQEELILQLALKGIEARGFFQPIHTFPFYKRFHNAGMPPLPVVEDISKRGLFLPVSIKVTVEDTKSIAEQLIELVRSPQPLQARLPATGSGRDLFVSGFIPHNPETRAKAERCE